MSKLTEQLRQVRVVNAWGFAAHGVPYIGYQASTSGRGSRSARWIVVRPGFQTDRDAHFLDHGNKVFSCGLASREKQLEAAKEWAGARYKITEWAKTPFGSWMDAGFVERRMKELKAQIATAELAKIGGKP